MRRTSEGCMLSWQTGQLTGTLASKISMARYCRRQGSQHRCEHHASRSIAAELNTDRHSGHSRPSPSSSSAINSTVVCFCCSTLFNFAGRPSACSNTVCASLLPTSGLSSSRRRSDQRPSTPPPQPQPPPLPRRIPSRSTITPNFYTLHIKHWPSYSQPRTTDINPHRLSTTVMKYRHRLGDFNQSLHNAY